MRVDALHAILILPGTQENLVLIKTMFTENILTLLQVRTIEEIKVRRLARSYLRRLTMKFQVDKTIQANFITSRCNVSIALMALQSRRTLHNLSNWVTEGQYRRANAILQRVTASAIRAQYIGRRRARHVRRPARRARRARLLAARPPSAQLTT